jgi:hypothetical protein
MATAGSKSHGLHREAKHRHSLVSCTQGLHRSYMLCMRNASAMCARNRTRLARPRSITRTTTPATVATSRADPLRLVTAVTVTSSIRATSTTTLHRTHTSKGACKRMVVRCAGSCCTRHTDDSRHTHMAAGTHTWQLAHTHDSGHTLMTAGTHLTTRAMPGASAHMSARVAAPECPGLR